MKPEIPEEALLTDEEILTIVMEFHANRSDLSKNLTDYEKAQLEVILRRVIGRGAGTKGYKAGVADTEARMREEALRGLTEVDTYWDGRLAEERAKAEALVATLEGSLLHSHHLPFAIGSILPCQLCKATRAVLVDYRRTHE